MRITHSIIKVSNLTISRRWYSSFLFEDTYEQGEGWCSWESGVTIVSEEKWNELYQQGKFAISGYVTGIIKQQLWSDSSTIYNKYYKYYNRYITMDEDFWMAYSEEH